MTHPPKIFKSRPESYNRNREEGATASAQPAYLTSPTGNEPGVLIRTNNRVRFIITASDAIRLANEIADSVEIAERA